MKHKIELKHKCKSCGATGLYSGMGEDKACAVVCHTCKGTGCQKFTYEYEDFDGKQINPTIQWVYETNPGIRVGVGGGYDFKDFGGISYDEWAPSGMFPPQCENRRFTCPAWWYQSADYKRKPDWDECDTSLGGTFSGCEHFSNKRECWARFDREGK